MLDLIDIIHIVGASGAGTTTLGQALEREYGYKWLDTDDYFWEDTDPPFVKPLPHEERVKRMSIAIDENPKCVISGSLCGWGDVFIPRFCLVVYADTPTDIRTRRLERREAERFGERILKGGDMYDNHIDFIEWAKGYDTSNEGRCRKTHEEWFKLLKCPMLRVDGTKPVNELVKQIAESGKIIESILPCFEINRPLLITQVYESAWDIDDAYVLKSNDNQDWLDKSIRLNRLLLSEGVGVTQYIYTADNKPYVIVEDKFWSLMKKIKGVVFDPYIGDPEENGIILGRAVAELHKALDNIEDKIEAYDSDFYSEFTSWIVPELEKHGVSFKDGVMDSMYTFFERDYKTLPRQLIHRDVHTSNLLFDGSVFSYLDFDMSQRNVRVFDLVYLGCSQLVDNYKDEVRLNQWREIFAGIIQGYSELLPLSEDEINSLPALFLFVEILFTAFYLKNDQPDIAEKCVDMTNWLYDNVSIITKKACKIQCSITG